MWIKAESILKYEAYRGKGANVPELQTWDSVGFLLFESHSLKSYATLDVLPLHNRTQITWFCLTIKYGTLVLVVERKKIEHLLGFQRQRFEQDETKLKLLTPTHSPLALYTPHIRILETAECLYIQLNPCVCPVYTENYLIVVFNYLCRKWSVSILTPIQSVLKKLQD